MRLGLGSLQVAENALPTTSITPQSHISSPFKMLALVRGTVFRRGFSCWQEHLTFLALGQRQLEGRGPEAGLLRASHASPVEPAAPLQPHPQPGARETRPCTVRVSCSSLEQLASYIISFLEDTTTTTTKNDTTAARCDTSTHGSLVRNTKCCTLTGLAALYG